MPLVSIIGTAGRYSNLHLLTAKLFDQMVDECHRLIIDEYKDPADVTLVSGGSAWADHVAVQLFLTRGYARLRLHLPCHWDATTCKFAAVVPSNAMQAHTSKVLNTLHGAFSKKMEHIANYSRNQIQRAINKGAVIFEYNSFATRNIQVAKAPHIIAMSWDEDEPKTGGTAYTWKRAKGRKSHISLHTLLYGDDN